MSVDSKSRRQRSKRGKPWPPWLRNPRLLKESIRIGVLILRLWRMLEALTRLFGG